MFVTIRYNEKAKRTKRDDKINSQKKKSSNYNPNYLIIPTHAPISQDIHIRKQKTRLDQKQEEKAS